MLQIKQTKNMHKYNYEIIMEFKIPYFRCTIDPGECVDDLIPKAKCYPCDITVTCKKIGPSAYSCDTSTTPNDTTSGFGLSDDVVADYPKAVRVNSKFMVQLRYPSSLGALKWYFDDVPYTKTFPSCQTITMPDKRKDI